METGEGWGLLMDFYWKVRRKRRRQKEREKREREREGEREGEKESHINFKQK